MKKGHLLRCLEHTAHNCGMDKALSMSALAQMGETMREEWKYRFELVKKSVRNALAQLDVIEEAAKQATCKEAMASIKELRKSLIFVQESTPDTQGIAAPAIHLINLRGYVLVALAHLMYLRRFANEARCQPIIDALDQQVIQFGHDD